MIRFAIALLAGVTIVGVVQAQSRVVIELPAKSAPPDRALKVALLPDAEGLTPGNAASRWRQAFRAFQESGVKFTEREEPWLSRSRTSLTELPRKEVRVLMDKARAALRMADEAARRRHSDWEYPPLTLPTAFELPFAEHQSFRDFAPLLSLRFRLELAEKKFDDAVTTLQTGLVLGRHMVEGPTVAQNLIGVAVISAMLGHVEELMQQPGAPNLYWSLTALPRPLIDLRKAVHHERLLFQRSFPNGGDFEKPRQAQKLLDEVVTVWIKESLYYLFTQNEEESGVQEKLSQALTTPALLPVAKKLLIEQGRKPDEVEAMPEPRAVLLWFVDRKTRLNDEMLQWAMLPPWQAVPALEGLDKKRAEVREKAIAGQMPSADVALELLSSRLAMLFTGSLRTERWIAGLRAVEAVRLQTDRDGRLPRVLRDVAVVPQPLDPWTGKGFDEFYSTAGDKAVLEVPLRPASDRRYEMALSK